ncbi:phage tail tape measure protein [Streptomyces sp. NPDC051016]|uniref:phage tail tape measure protein n=1 Tax=Streptomyces sp. NPDC051016 TaxID=3365638 RepID=UPI003796DCA8
MATSTIVYALVGRDRASAVFRQVGRSAGNLASTSSRAGRVIGQAMEVGALAVGAIGVSAIKTAGDFEKSMNRVEALSGASGKQLTKLRDQAKDLGTTTQYSAKETADAMGELATAGLNVNQIYGSMPSVLALASSENLSLSRSADITTSVMTGYGMTVKQIPHAVDAMVKASVKANTSVDDIGEAFKYAGPIAHQAGLKFEETVASMALMGNAGIKASMAGTALRGAVTRLLSPTKQVQKTLDKLGISVRTSSGKLLPMTKIVDQLAKKGATTGDIMTIFGQRAGPGMAALIQQGSDKLANLTKELEHSGGTAEKISKIQMKGLNGEITRLKNAWSGLMIEIGDTGVLTLATKALAGVTNGVRGLAQWVNKSGIPTAKHFGSELGHMIPVQQIKSGADRAKTVVTDFFKGLAGTKKKAKEIVSDLFDLDPHLGSGKTAAPSKTPTLTPMPHYGVGQVAPANGQIADAGKFAMPHGGSGLTAPLAKVKVKPPKSLAQQIGEQVRIAFTEGITHVDWDKFGPVLGNGLGSAFKWLGVHGTALSIKLGDAIGKIDWVIVGKRLGVVAVPFAIGVINTLFDPLFHKDFWSKHWLDAIIAAVSIIPVGKAVPAGLKLGAKLGRPLFEGVGAGLGRIPWSRIIPFSAKLTEALGPVLRGVRGWVGRVTQGFIDGFRSRFPRVAQFFEDQLTLLPVRVGDLGRLLKRKGGELIDKFQQGLLSRLPFANNSVVKWFYKFWGRFTLYQVGINLIQGLLSGIWSAVKDIGAWLKSHLVDPVVDGVKGLFGIHSPSTVFAAIGVDLIAGLKSGVASAAKGIGGWARGTFGTPIVSAFAGASGWLLSRGKSLVGGWKSGIGGGAKGIGTWVRSHVVTPTTSVFTNAKSWLVSKGSSLVSGLKSGISSGVSGIGSWLKKALVDPIVNAVKHYFGIHSPSKVFQSIGGHLVSGLMRGLSTTNGTSIAKTVFGSLPKALGALVKKGLVSVESLPSKALSALGGLGGDLLSLLGLGGSGGGSSANQKIGQTLAAARGWSGPQWAALKNLWTGESGWNERALNKASGAYGIPQSLPASKMASAGSDWKTSAATQIKWGLGYIASRYGNPVNAYSQWLARSPHWYAKGTKGGAAKGLAWVGERGPELVDFKGGEDVLSHPDSVAFAKTHGIRLPGYASGTILNAADRVTRDKRRVADAKDDLARARERRKGVAAAETRLAAARKELQAAEVALKNAKRTAKTSISNTINTGLLKTLETGTSAKIASTVKSLATKLLNAGYDKTAANIQKKGSQLQTLSDKRASVQAKISAAQTYASDQAGKINDFLSISGTSATSVGDLISQMGSNQKTASSFVQLSKSLKARGASKALLDQLAEAGPGSQLATILGSKDVTTQDIDKLNRLTASGSKLATNFGKSMADMMYDTGKHAGEGFLSGLKATEKDLQKQIDKLATSLVKSIKKALGIKSPSTVMRDKVGKQIALGVAKGIDTHVPHVLTSAQRMADAAAGVSTGRVVIPSPASTAASQQAAAARELAAAVQAASTSSGDGQFVGELRLDSGELLGLIRGTVKPMIKASEKKLAYEAKVGPRG